MRCIERVDTPMFRDISIEVTVGTRIVFKFAEPVSVETLLVANASEDVLWDILAEEFQPIPVIDASFRIWPINEAPPELLALLNDVRERDDLELATNGPRKRPLSEIVYGELPSGYREKTPAKTLLPGEYNVMFFGEQGRGAAHFFVR